MISAVSGQGDLRFMVHEGTVDAPVFRDSLKRLLVGATQPIYLVLDGQPIHKSKLVRNFVAAQEGKLKLIYLPPYSPQLNPDEQVRGNVKRRVAKNLPQNKIELKQMLSGARADCRRCPPLFADSSSIPIAATRLHDTTF
jgi:transposase